MNTTISNRDDVIDSRDVIVRIVELKTEREDLVNDLAESESILLADPTLAQTVAEQRAALEAWDEGDEGAELRELQTYLVR